MDLIERNASETLFLTDGRQVMMFPKGFAQAFPDEDPEGIFDEDGAEGSLFGYYSPSEDPSADDIDLGYQPVLPLRRGLADGSWREVSEAEARVLHPLLFDHLARIDRGER